MLNGLGDLFLQGFKWVKSAWTIRLRGMKRQASWTNKLMEFNGLDPIFIFHGCKWTLFLSLVDIIPTSTFIFYGLINYHLTLVRLATPISLSLIPTIHVKVRYPLQGWFQLAMFILTHSKLLATFILDLASSEYELVLPMRMPIFFRFNAVVGLQSLDFSWQWSSLETILF